MQPAPLPTAAADVWRLSIAQQVLVALIMLAPVLATATLLPTFHIDTAETVMWGRYAPMLGTHKHPPMMGWIGALIEYAPGRAAWQAVLLQIVLNIITVGYLSAIAGWMMDARRRLLFTVGMLVSLLVTLWPVTGYALNADVVQMPFWAGAVYHALAAERTGGRWWHWPLSGLMIAGAILTKYFAGVLALALLAASLMVQRYRMAWRRPGPWLALLAGALALLPHLIWLWFNRERLGFIAGRLSSGAGYGVGSVADGLFQFAASFVVLGVPMIGMAGLVAWWREKRVRLDFAVVRTSDEARFVLVFFAVACALSVLFIGLGVTYWLRFNAPLYGFAALIWFVLLPMGAAPSRQAYLDGPLKLTGVLWALCYLALTLIYAVFGEHIYMQEPARQVAEALKAEWQARYRCGPAYVVGDIRPARIMALYYGRPVMGVPFDDIPAAPWYDPERLEREGAIGVVWYPQSVAALQAFMPPGTEIRTIARQRLVSRAAGVQSYTYAFKPPKECPATK